MLYHLAMHLENLLPPT